MPPVRLCPISITPAIIAASGVLRPAFVVEAAAVEQNSVARSLRRSCRPGWTVPADDSLAAVDMLSALYWRSKRAIRTASVRANA